MFVDAICCRWYSRSVQPQSSQTTQNNQSLHPANSHTMPNPQLSSATTPLLQGNERANSNIGLGNPTTQVVTGPYSVDSPLLTQS